MLADLAEGLFHAGDLDESERACNECLAVAREAQYPFGVARALNVLHYVLAHSGRRARALRVAEEALAICQAIGHKRETARLLLDLGGYAREADDLHRARALGAEALALSREIRSPLTMMNALSFIGGMELLCGRLERAKGMFEECLALSETLKYNSCNILNHLAQLHGRTGHHGRATESAKSALRAGWRDRHYGGMLWSLQELASAARAQHEWARAARLLGATEALYDSVGWVMRPETRRRHDDLAASCRDALGIASFDPASAEARAMTLEEVVAYALEDELDDAPNEMEGDP
jgi:tetratricopeptide (TPR) repeat protein